MPTVAILIFEGVNGLDVAGPLEAFAAVRDEGGKAAYAISCWSLDGRIVRSESGLQLCGDPLPAKPKRTDLLIVPGGSGLREPRRLAKAARWLNMHNARFQRIASVCTGAFALAESGLINGRTATTHWRFARELATRHPRVRVDPDALYVRDGKYFSSAGITAGIDLSLALIEQDHGARAATAVARELVVFLRRTGGQAQFSEPLKLQTRASDRLSSVCSWAANHLGADLSVTALAERAGLSERQFTRLFVASFAVPPAQYIAHLRLDAARTALSQPRASVDAVAQSVGFRSADGFRRAFEKRFGINPGEYRRRFSARSSR